MDNLTACWRTNQWITWWHIYRLNNQSMDNLTSHLHVEESINGNLITHLQVEQSISLHWLHCWSLECTNSSSYGTLMWNTSLWCSIIYVQSCTVTLNCTMVQQCQAAKVYISASRRKGPSVTVRPTLHTNIIISRLLLVIIIICILWIISVILSVMISFFG